MTITEPATEALIDTGSWWRAPFRMYQTNLREIDAGMDVEAVLDIVQEYGANAWLLNAGGIMSFYPTDLPFQTRNPYLQDRPSADFVGDAVAAASARGVRVLARMDFSKVSTRIASEHPDWLFVGPDQSKQTYNGLVSACPSAGYYQEAAFAVIAEFAARYPIDGFFFNWFSFNEIDYSRTYRGVCHCTACTSGFKEFSGGRELPAGRGDADYALWRRYAEFVINDLTARFREHIHDVRPNAALILGERADIVFHEANSALGREFWPFATGEAVSLSKSVRPDVPVLVNAAVFVDMPYRYAAIQPEHFAHYAVQAVARGAVPSAYTMGTPLATPYPNMALASQVVHAHREHEDVYGALRPSAELLLIADPRQTVGAAVDEYRGVYEALQRAHIPFDIAPWQGIPEALAGGRYAIVVVPDLRTEADQATIAALDSFVDSGHTVVTTGGILFDEDRPQLAGSPALRRSASTEADEELRNSYIAVDEPGYGDGYRRVVPVAGSYHYIECHPDAERHMRYVAQAPYGPPELCHGTFPLDYPGWAVRRYGTGRVVLVPWGIGATARMFGTGAIGAWFADLITGLLPECRIEVRNLPESVELIVGESAGRLVVHLLNFSGVRHNSIGPEVPIRHGEIIVPGATSARSLVAGQTIETVRDDGRLVVPVPEFGIYEALVLELEGDGRTGDRLTGA